MGASDSVGKESACNAGNSGSIPVSGRSPGEGNGSSLQYLAWRSPWTKEPGGLQSMGSQESDMTYRLNHQGINVQICKDNILRKDCFFHLKRRFSTFSVENPGLVFYQKAVLFIRLVHCL